MSSWFSGPPEPKKPPMPPIKGKGESELDKETAKRQRAMMAYMLTGPTGSKPDGRVLFGG